MACAAIAVVPGFAVHAISKIRKGRAVIMGSVRIPKAIATIPERVRFARSVVVPVYASVPQLVRTFMTIVRRILQMRPMHVKWMEPVTVTVVAVGGSTVQPVLRLYVQMDKDSEQRFATV